MTHKYIIPRHYTQEEWKTNTAVTQTIHSHGIIIDANDGAIAVSLGDRSQESIANARLIKHAPEMDKVLEQAYLQIQRLAEVYGLHAQTDSIRAQLRNVITAANNFDSQTYQEEIEALARRMN